MYNTNPLTYLLINFNYKKKLRKFKKKKKKKMNKSPF